MSLTKAIEHGKEHRKPWRDWREVSVGCRNHGVYSWKYLGWKYKARKARLKGVEPNAADNTD